MVNFLSVPLKSTNEVDLIKPLQNYVATILDAGSDLTQEINEGIVELNKLRNRACNQPVDKSQSSLDLLTRYYDQLCVIENKLPISATLNPISFKWKDAFDKGSLFFSRASLTISDASFERAAVLFNSGALMSAIASSQPHNTDEELKATARLFQQAAGVFSKLKDTVLGMVQQEPTPDLMPDTLAALSALMVAQAQESIYIKAAKDQMKPQSLTKIAAQCGEFYQDAQKFMARDVVKGIWDKEWLNTVAGKSLAYNALAQFQQAEACGESKDIGEQLSRLKEADKLMEQSKSYVPPATFGTEQALIKKSLAQATKDNDFLYHERVPDFKTLPLLPKAALAKPLPVNFPLSPRFKDLFESLVPVQVQSALSTFEARKAELINVETGRMREYTQVMNAQLASINLPAALDDATNHEKCPESIRQKSSKVKSAGGLEAIQSKLSELPSLFKRNEEILTETSRLLREEKESDESLRRQFGAKWTRVHSDQLTAPLQQEVGKYRGILTTATNADAIVAKKFEDNRRAIDLLSKPEIELANAIPSISANGDGGNSEAVRQLRSCMDRVQEIKVEREALEKQLKEVRFDMSNDFLKSMSENGVVNEEKLSSDKITDLYGPLKERVNQSIKRQEEVMAEVQRWNTAFVQEKGSGGVERESTLKMLASAYDVYFELEGNLKEGMKFYNDLTPILVRLQQKVSDFCFARQTEKEDLMKQVQQNIISGGSQVGDAPKNPPPRPPPPSVPGVTGAHETPVPPPRTQSSAPYQAAPAPQAPSGPFNAQQPPAYQQTPQPYGQPNPYVPYSQASPYGYAQPPQQQQPPFQPQFQQNYATPYPVTYPGTYPGAYPQQQWGAYPPHPNFPQQPQQPPQQQNQPPNNPFQ